MHDCPGCQVPLHGHESFCPVCGTKQNVKPEFLGSQMASYNKASNPVPLILLIVIVLGLILFAVQNSWIGALISRGPLPASETMSAPAAREKLENTILESVAGQSKSCKFIYTANEKTVTRDYPQPVDLTVEVYLNDPSIRKTIVEPAKPLMVPAQINSLVLKDNKSHATITYNVSVGVSNEDETNQGAGNNEPEGTTTDNSEQDASEN